MNILVVDDEELILWKLHKEIRNVFPDDNISVFEEIKDAKNHVLDLKARNESLEYAFLDIHLRDGNGIELAKLIRVAYPEVKIVFCTAHKEYAFEAFEVHAIGYLLKPVKADDIASLLIETGNSIDNKKNIHIRTFGNFDVFVDGKIVVFTRSKAKELLAYLVDRRGSSVTTAEAFNILWEGEPYTKAAKDKVQHVKKDLKEILVANGIEDILISNWNGMAIDSTKIDCDYYSFLDGNIDAIKKYNGEYMLNYDWAESTVGNLNNKWM